MKIQKSGNFIFAILFFSIFSSVMGVGIVVPLLPIYALTLGAGGVYVAFIFGAFSLSRTIMLPWFGKASDRKGRKPYLIAGLFAYALISVAFVLSSGVEALIGVRFVQGIASAMIMPSAQAYIGDITPKGKEGTVMGLFNLSIFGGLSIGPLLGGIIHDHFSMNAAFLCMGGLSLSGFALCLLFLPPTKLEKVVTRNTESPRLLLLIQEMELIGFFIFRLVYTFCIGIIWCFLPVFANLEFGLSGSEIGILVTLAVLVSGLLNVPMGFAADRFNKKAMIFLGGVIITWSIHSFAMADGFMDLLIANFLFGLGGGISMPALTALAVIKGNQTGSMGSVMAILTMAHSLGMLLGSLIAGMAMEFISLRYAFPLGAVFMIFGMTVFFFCCRKKVR